MKRHSFVRWSIPTLVALTVLLPGCSLFHHHDRVEYYKGAAETRPLEVPPDLDTPSTSKELVVPGATAAGAAAITSTSAQPPASSMVGDTTELHVADTADSTWQRIGVALERAQVGKISSRDAATRSYALDFDAAADPQDAAPAPEHHWYSRILHPFGGDADNGKPHHITSSLHINVSEDAGGARVNVIGSPDDKSAPAATHRVIEVLRERLS